MGTKKDIQNVAVAIDLSGASWRDFLTGFSDYARTGVHWNIKLLQYENELSADAVRPLLKGGLDGLVTGIRPSNETSALLRKSAIPVVVIGMDDGRLGERTGATTFIRNDNEEIGRYAARHFAKLGNFSSFAFVSTNTDAEWAKLRAHGFQEIVKGNKGEFHSFLSRLAPGSADDLRRLSRWLIELPKPAAVFVAYDLRATHVLTACKDAKLAVPGQVAVLGVDNDRLLCDFADPPLSSISPDHEKEGRIAAEALERMMRRPHDTSSRRVLVTDKKIVERESAVPRSPSAALVRRAADYMRCNSDRNIKVPDVARHLGVSRSLLDMRFREILGTTTSDMITQTRLNEVKRLLRETAQPIRRISEACGFSSPAHLKNLFKRQFGLSMREFRQH